MGGPASHHATAIPFPCSTHFASRIDPSDPPAISRFPRPLRGARHFAGMSNDPCDYVSRTVVFSHLETRNYCVFLAETPWATKAGFDHFSARREYATNRSLASAQNRSSKGFSTRNSGLANRDELGNAPFRRSAETSGRRHFADAALMSCLAPLRPTTCGTSDECHRPDRLKPRVPEAFRAPTRTGETRWTRRTTGVAKSCRLAPHFLAHRRCVRTKST